MSARRTGEAGFTLIEILVGLSILALLVSMIQGIYASAARNREAADAKTATVHAASSVMARMADELGAAFVSKARADRTYFHVTVADKGRSTLEFATLMPPVHGLRAGGETRVRYEASAAAKEEGGGVVLKRTEVDDLGKELDREGATYEMLKGVTRFTVEAFDGKEWLEEWRDADSADPKLPLAIKIEVAWNEGEAERTFETSATIYGAAP